MSEEAETEANHLCAPEDAFEQFQAVSMYEEDEYITLADIVPPKSKPPDLGELICEQPYDNEVVIAADNAPTNTITITNKSQDMQYSDGGNLTYASLETVGNSQVQENNSIEIQPDYSTEVEVGVNGEEISTNMELDDMDNLGQIHHSVNSVEDSLQDNLYYPSDDTNNLVTYKRGRKPKDSFQQPASNLDNSTAPFSSDPEHSDTSSSTGRKRRGRPRKTPVVEPPVAPKPKGRPGRPKKRSLGKIKLNGTGIENENIIVDKTEKELINSNILNSETKSRRRKKPQNITKTKNTDSGDNIHSKFEKSSNDSINDDLDDISLSKLKDVPELPASFNENNPDIVSEHVKNSDQLTKGKKRGRKSKKVSETPLPVPSQDIILEQEDIPYSIDTTIDDDDADDICLSKLKTDKETSENYLTPITEQNKSISESQETNTVEKDSENVKETSTKRSTKVPVMSDFEYNIDSVIGNYNNTEDSLLVEDTSKRPSRRKIQSLKYDEESDEDPFANIELSDDDEPRKRKGKYNDDDEYIPGKRETSKVDSSDSDINDDLIGEVKKPKRKMSRKSEGSSPRKRGKKDLDSLAITDVHSTADLENDDKEASSQSVKSSGDSAPSQHTGDWGGTVEFENFLATKIQSNDLKIKKVSSSRSSEKQITPLQIPVIEADAKKTIEISCQTNKVTMSSTGMQTEPRYHVPMKDNVALTPSQSEKACHFLNSIVKTTAELGQLMTQKSEDFIKKKINKEHVTDTFKMDYCVKKSFLLFKLAKSNLMQMEEDLAKQYEDFLNANNLLKCREEMKVVAPKPKETNGDSDCEIVDEQPPSKSNKPAVKPKFNPKTVFLNKELSIKIAKKPQENIITKSKKLDIKGRHTVWINDTVMVKKVAPTQSFLAQDSRNKKPPDNRITNKMVSDFFTDYYRQQALSICAPFVTRDWLKVSNECACYYFVVEPNKFETHVNFPDTSATETNNNINIKASDNKLLSSKTPETLFIMCFRFVKNHLYGSNEDTKTTHKPNDIAEDKNNPMTLLQLSLKALNIFMNEMEAVRKSSSTSKIECLPLTTYKPVLPLKELCHRRIVELLFDSSQKTYEEPLIEPFETQLDDESCSIDFLTCSPNTTQSEVTCYMVKPLITLCVEFIQREQSTHLVKPLITLCVEFIQREQSNHEIIYLPQKLMNIAFLKVKELLYKNSQVKNKQVNHSLPIEGLTINSVNTLSEEAFLNLELSHADIPEDEYIDEFDNDELYEPEYDNEVDNQETNWVSQVQQELRSCFSVANVDINHEHNENTESENVPIVTQIKLEPVEDAPDNLDPIVTVKSEPVHGLDEMTVIPNVKSELMDQHLSELLHGQEIDDIYSQSGQRIRRQHEPDYVEDYVPNLGLLVPQTYEPLVIETAKGSLMESSSDESNKNKKGPTKKKIDKRKSKQKKPEPKPTKEPVTSKTKAPNSEVAILTRKMRERIRQEKDSSDSETETLPRLRSKKETDKPKPSQTKPTDKPKPAQTKATEKVIQCNNVDSTDQNEEENLANFTGFSAIDQNEISSYQKYMKFVYDKIIPSDDVTPKADDNTTEQPKSDEKVATVKTKPPTKAVTKSKRSISPVINPDDPVELLECEPTMPVFYDKDEEKVPIIKKQVKKTDTTSFIDRHGWHCYPINSSDKKLYEKVNVNLEKLPESFVQTYFEYQEINVKDKNDDEINRLTNLNSLNRTNQLGGKSRRLKKGGKTDDKPIGSGSRSNSPLGDVMDDRDELTPSEDEGTKAEDETPPPLALKHTENNLAKNLLMNDNDSDSDSGRVKIKQEPRDAVETNAKTKTKSKGKKAEEPAAHPEDLMLTADKSLNKELTLLHAPVVLDAAGVPGKAPATKHKQKSSTKHRENSKAKNDEDSSSEEEKQWVNTKEKLLKRMGKKDYTSIDDAKRAKLVTEFIERRGGNMQSRKHTRPRSRRSAKKFLEREKQLRVLSQELFGETSNDPTIGKRSAAYYKGRRNIRKVIDKKSLARSTVKANMEEFERKRRLNSRQTRLKELLGCEEDVNVLVINDEVCLEYDFEEHRPVVTVHPFFTKVMKAHQYEGVKFMWDACFESLSNIESGEPGGGCILAHCMGLGKTLQVLALLHTVLTHPRAGMQRVLVCCPLSTVLNWVDEIHKWIGPVTNQIKVFELSKLKKTYERAYQLEDWYSGGGIFIIGYELFRSLSTLDPDLDDVRPTIINKIRTALLDPGPDIVVCDEGHLLKNDCSVLAVAMSRVVTKRRIVLTGTPMQNNLREYYCMVNFVKPNLLGTYSEYSNRFENPIMNGQHRDSQEEDIKLMKARTHILHKVLEGCLQRQEASVLYPYLPKKHEYTVFIALTKCQWDLYKHYLNHYANKSKQSVLRDFHMLQKIWSHPQVLHNFQTKARKEKDRIKAEKLEDDLATEDLEDIKPSTTELWWLDYLDGGNMLETLDSSNKFVAVFRILEECIGLGDKVLIFSTSLFSLDALEYFLKKINKWSLGQEYYRLDGSVPAEVRQKWCREFNAENNLKTKLFLVSTRAGCLGLNMTAANRVIILDTSWNPAHDIQSIFRVYRFGQKKDCYIYRLVAMGTMEQKIYERSVTKQAVACRVVDEQQIDRHYNMAELTELYKYDEAGAGVAGGVALGVRDVALLRVARSAALHAVHEHDSLLRGSAEQGLPEHERAAAWNQFQQEQQHKQYENKLITDIPKLALKRVHGHDYTKRFISPTQEIKTEFYQGSQIPKKGRSKKELQDAMVSFDQNQILPDQGHNTMPQIKIEPSVALTGKKSINKLVVPINVQPGTSKAAGSKGRARSDEPSRDQEEIMVEQIAEILVKYNFHSKIRTNEVSKLVSNVTSIVKMGYIEDGTDELTASIARVLLMKRMSIPVVNNIMCESINNTDLPLNKESGKEKAKTSKSELENKGKRKAAVVAAEQMDSMTVINLDDDDTDFVPNPYQMRGLNQNKKSNTQNRNDSPEESVLPDVRQSDTDSSPETEEINNELPLAPAMAVNGSSTKPRPRGRPRKPVVEQSQSMSVTDISSKTLDFNDLIQHTPAMNLGKNSGSKPRPRGRPRKSKLEERNFESNQSSILLSDDEEPKSTKNLDTTEDDEQVALPVALLSNKNFINIVAHTYLVGNPMLDEDAATLAAQYSTLKALKETEQTGAPIYSGPIHDIAVKVIGKTLLKKMNSMNAKMTSLSSKNSDTEQMREQMLASAMSKSSTDASKRAIVEELCQEAPRPTVTGIITSAESHSVVPVGLINNVGIPRNESLTQPDEECILPDDDVTLVSPPALRPATFVQTPAKQLVKTETPTTRPKPGPKRYKIKEVWPAPTSLMSSGMGEGRSVAVLGMPRSVAAESVAKRVAAESMARGMAAESVGDTICLDSDEEQPVPVALTRAAPTLAINPGCTPISVSRKPSIITRSTDSSSISLCPDATAGPSQPSPSPMVLKSVNTSKGKSKFILVPMTHLSTVQAQQHPEETAPQGAAGPSDVSQTQNAMLPALTPRPPPAAPRPAPLAFNAPPQTPNILNFAAKGPPIAPMPHAPSSSTASNTEKLRKKITKTKCKPGDMFRITNDGVIEVINIEDIVSKEAGPSSSNVDLTGTTTSTVLGSIHPSETPAPTVPRQSQPASRQFKPTSRQSQPAPLQAQPAPLQAPPAPLQAPPAPRQAPASPHKVPPAPRQSPPPQAPASKRPSRVRLSSSSSSSSSSEDSRPSSPDNPLSCLKDVVHIQAAIEPTRSRRSMTASKEKPEKSNIGFQHVTDTKKTSPGGITIFQHKTAPKQRDDDAQKVGSSALLNRLKVSVKPNANKPAQNISTSKSLPMAPGQKASEKIVIVQKGTSKDIVITAGKNMVHNKKPVSVDVGKSKTSVTKPQPSSSKYTDIRDKKRPSTSIETSAPKKMKQQPMTLKDFNLDDIDDIIELD